MKENSIKKEQSSIEKDIKKLRESIIEEKYHIYNKDLKIILEHILSDYKRVLKENELLRQQNISYKNNIHELKEVRNKW